MHVPDNMPPGLAALAADLPLEALAFSLVRVKPRRDGWTPDRQRGFIIRLALCGSVAAAARAVGMARESAWRLRAHKGAASFAAAWDTALQWGEDCATDIGIERALRGEVRPVYFRGRKLGEFVRHDNRLAMTVLSRLDRAEARLLKTKRFSG